MTVMVTSATNKLSLDHDYLIREWEAAALDKPSITSLDCIAEIPQDTWAPRVALDVLRKSISRRSRQSLRKRQIASASRDLAIALQQRR